MHNIPISNTIKELNLGKSIWNKISGLKLNDPMKDRVMVHVSCQYAFTMYMYMYTWSGMLYTVLIL